MDYFSHFGSKEDGSSSQLDDDQCVPSHISKLPSASGAMENSKKSKLHSSRVEKEGSSSRLSQMGQGSTFSTFSVDSSDDNTQRNRYDVFISFRGSDTRNTFVDHLYSYLTRKGIFAFKDDTRLQKGESISPQLLQAIQHSRISIVVFSKDYASSTWCLDEMAAIADCRTKFKQIVFPVFYDVDPSHVRKQNGVYENAFLLHTESSKCDLRTIDRWQTEMTYLARLAGWDVRNESEVRVIEKIAEAVIKKLGHKFSGSADDLIGVQPRIEALESLLKLSSKDDSSRVLGIWGMSGIGKTTLATVLYDRISYQFDACCFVENVNKIYEDGGAMAVQKQILCRAIEEKNLDTYSPPEISRIVRNRLHNIKLLVVLDDVDQFEQLENLNINPKLLHTGSRIITITTDEHILRTYGVDMVYEAQLMNDNDAHKLFCRKAFKSDYSSHTFTELVPEVLKYAQCLPLAISVMGSFLCSRSATQWKSTLDKFRKNPPDKIMKVLQVSYEGLEAEEKETFLHVACFFNRERKDYVSRILDACGLHPDIEIQLIAEKSLITVRNEEIHMHEMLQELGKQIVRGQYPDEPEFWSRLWLYRDFHHVMMTEMKENEVKAVILNQMEDGLQFNKLRAEDLSKMKHLKLLILYQKNFSGEPIYLANSLRYLLWNGYPFISLPSNFQPYHLVELNMPNSSIEQLWMDVQHLPYLKRMDLSNSKNLKMTPSFEGMQNLERLDLTGCINLWHVHSSIGRLKELKFLSLQNCSGLVGFDFGSVSKLSSLRVVCLSGCTKLEYTPDFTGATNLEYLDMDRCASLFAIHKSIGALTKLKFLSVRDCRNLVRIPDSFNNMTSLMTLDLCSCSKLTNIPLGWIFSSPPLQNLIFLDLSFCNISNVPEAIGELHYLERLNLQGNNFSTTPLTFKTLYCLSYLNLSHCHSLEHFPSLPTESGPANAVGRYFKTTSKSRNHRSGLYIFDCPKVAAGFWLKYNDADEKLYINFQLKWLLRMVKEPLHFRCGFDIVLPRHWINNGFTGDPTIPKWFNHRFNGGSTIRIENFNMPVIGFVFCVAFELNNSPAAVPGSPHHSLSSRLPYPFYLSFESEHTEECFDMPLRLELNKVDGSSYLWTIYISQEHCHFVKTGARITFKAHHGLIIKEWGLRVLIQGDIEGLKGGQLRIHLPIHAVDIVEESSNNNSFEPKIQLPYNWLVTGEDEVENDEAKGKEINLFNLGLLTDRPQ